MQGKEKHCERKFGRIFVDCDDSPLRRSAPAPPKGEPLAGRSTLSGTLEVYADAKSRALLTRAAASGQAPCQAAVNPGSVTEGDGEGQMPVKSKLGVYSSRALLFCCI